MDYVLFWPHSRMFTFSFYLLASLSKEGIQKIERIRKEERIRQKKRELHELIHRNDKTISLASDVLEYQHSN